MELKKNENRKTVVNIKIVHKCYLTAILLFPTTLGLFGQAIDLTNNPLSSKITAYGLSKSSPVLFAHFDKNVYVPNEYAWFAAYLLNTPNEHQPTVLSLLLVDDQHRKIFVRQRFMMTNGLSSGNIIIPDTLPPGNYSILLYTNLVSNGIPIDNFIQPITIKTAVSSNISASLALVDAPQAANGENRQILLMIKDKNGQPLPDAEIKFRLGDNTLPSTPVKTDKIGEYRLTIPINNITSANNLLTAEIALKSESKILQLNLPVSKNEFSVKFYPEGGNLIHGTSCSVGWEVLGTNGEPVRISGLLLKDKKIIDTVETTRYGMGKFKLIPFMDSKYELKPLGVSDQTTYPLPVILSQGPVLSVDNGIVNDSLNIRLVSKIPGKYRILVHNYQKAFFLISTDVGAAGRRLVILLKDVPRGLSEITVLDTAGRPLAERLFFAHYDQKPKTNITIDYQRYTTRQKVNLKIRVSSFNGDSTNALFSIACVQSNRLKFGKNNDIASYFYLANELGQLPLKNHYMGASSDDKAYLENVLLVKGWRRYTWQEMLQQQKTDTLAIRIVSPFEAKVTHNGKALKKPKNIMVMTDSTTNVVTTDKSGYFKLSGKDILNTSDRKVHLILNGLNTDFFVNAINGFRLIDSAAVKALPVANYADQHYTSMTDSLMIKGPDQSINLREVKIVGKKDNQIYDAPHVFAGTEENSCGDYVCRYNVLNCQNHRNESDNRPPIIGETYYTASGARVPYKGCLLVPTASSMAIEGINYPKEFYVSDYSKFKIEGPEYISTIFWKPSVYIDSKGEASLSFYTSDLTGPYSIIIQGMTTHDVFYDEKEFEIVKAR